MHKRERHDATSNDGSSIKMMSTNYDAWEGERKRRRRKALGARCKMRPSGFRENEKKGTKGEKPITPSIRVIFVPPACLTLVKEGLNYYNDNTKFFLDSIIAPSWLCFNSLIPIYFHGDA